MTHDELKHWALKRLDELRAQGKNPHGELRDLLIDMQLEEEHGRTNN